MKFGADMKLFAHILLDIQYDRYPFEGRDCISRIDYCSIHICSILLYGQFSRVRSKPPQYTKTLYLINYYAAHYWTRPIQSKGVDRSSTYSFTAHSGYAYWRSSQIPLQNFRKHGTPIRRLIVYGSREVSIHKITVEQNGDICRIRDRPFDDRLLASCSRSPSRRLRMLG